MRADDRRGLAHRRAKLAQRVAREELRRHLALRGASLLNRGRQPPRRLRQDQKSDAVARKRAAEQARKRKREAARGGIPNEIDAMRRFAHEF